MSKAQTLASTVSTGNVLADGTVAYAEVSGTPTLATVATSGSYTDLINQPTISATATNIAGGSNGTIPYQSAADTTAMLAVGTAGQVLQTNGAAAPTWVNPAVGGLTLGTPVAATSGTSIDFTGIPAGIKQITISFKATSTNGTSVKMIQIGDSGGVETSDYSSMSYSFIGTAVSGISTGNGIAINSALAAQRMDGSVILTLENSTTNSWAFSGVIADTQGSNAVFITGGLKSLSAALDRVRVTTSNGTDAFDFGEINISYI